MICDWAMLCHDIEPHEESGGLSIIGVFSQLLVDRLPGTVNPLSLAVRLSGMLGESGVCSVVVLNPSGAVLRALPTEHITLRIGFVDFSVPLGPISLKQPGVYFVTISIDGTELRRMPMPVQIVTVA